MSIMSELLNNTLDSRKELFFNLLDEKAEQFKDTVIDGALCKIPKVNQIPNKRYYQFKVKLPIGYETTTKYRIRFLKNIYDFYKKDNNYYIIDIPGSIQNLRSFYDDFRVTILFSFTFYLVHTLLKELTSSGITIDLTDQVYCGLLDKFHTQGGQLKFTLTPFSCPNKTYHSDHFYLSIFN